MAEKEKCSNPEVLDLLPWYMAKSLPADELASIEKHLSSCMYCSEELDKIKWLSEGIQGIKTEKDTGHINSALLTIYSENKKELKKQIIRRIDEHLSVCPFCAEELEILTTVNRSLEAQSKKHLFSNLFESIESFFSNYLLKPAFAYVLVLLLIYPAWMGLFKTGDQTVQGFEPVNISEHFVLQQANQRGPSGMSNIVELENTNGMFTLSFPLPTFDIDDIVFDAKIVDEKNKIIWQTSNLHFMDEYGSVLLLFSKRFFESGSYTLIVSQGNTHTGKTSDEYQYDFKVRLVEGLIN